MPKCFRCGSKLYLDNDRVIHCSLCTATGRETGYTIIRDLDTGEWKITKYKDRNSFYLYRWGHAHHSREWYHANREIGMQIRVEEFHWTGERRYHIGYRMNDSETWHYVDPSWKTLKTAKKWALVWGYDPAWVKEFFSRHD